MSVNKALLPVLNEETDHHDKGGKKYKIPQLEPADEGFHFLGKFRIRMIKDPTIELKIKKIVNAGKARSSHLSNF